MLSKLRKKLSKNSYSGMDYDEDIDIANLSKEGFIANFKDLYAKERASTHFTLEEFLERIKIVEMKVSHLSKSPKKKAPQGQDADLDDEKEDLEGRLRSHFETAFTSALEKLESYGEIVSDLQECIVKVTERIENLEISKEQFFGENQRDSRMKKNSEESINIIGEIEYSGKKKKISEIPADIMNEVGKNREGSDEKDYGSNGSFIIHKSEEDINLFQDVDTKFNDMREEFFAAIQQIEGTVETRFDGEEKIRQEKFDEVEKKLSNFVEKIELGKLIGGLEKNFEKKIEGVEKIVSETPKVDMGKYVTEDVLGGLRDEMRSFETMESVQKRIEELRKEIKSSMDSVTGGFLNIEEVKKISSESQQEMSDLLRMEIDSMFPIVSDLEQKVTQLLSESSKNSEVGDMIIKGIRDFVENDERFSRINELEKIQGIHERVEAMDKTLADGLGSLRLKAEGLEEELGRTAKVEELTTLANNLESKLGALSDQEKLSSMESTLETLENLHKNQKEKFENKLGEIELSLENLKPGQDDGLEAKKEVEEKVKEISARVNEALEAKLNELKEKIDEIEEKVEEAEDEREMSENKREKKELERQLNESKREQNEQGRIDEEKERVKKENLREDKLATLLPKDEE